MKKMLLFVVLCFTSILASAGVNDMLGEWRTVDDKSGEVRSVVKIYKGTDGLYYGKIIKLMDQPQDAICEPCEGADHNKPVVGLVIVRGMKEVDGELRDGRVLDPESGKIYYCKISLKDGKLQLRGSLDKKGFLGRNQTWIR